ncbi:MAG TPA: DNA translocase FtsK [Bacteroidales bacterium]|nr:DNA translocase FtsK [Bacteroidales bacterium]
MANPVKHIKKSSPSKPKTGFLHKRETWISLGVLWLVFVTWLTIVLISFLFSGGSDQSLVYGLSFGELGSLTGKTLNIGGSYGAWTANIIINDWFGYAFVFMLVFGWILGFRLLGLTKASLIKHFLLNGFGLVWTSLALAFFLQPLIPDSFIIPGGAHGFWLSEWLIGHVGWPGALLIILSSLFIFLIFVKASTLPFVQRILAWKPFAKKSQTLEETENASFDKVDGEWPEEFDKSWTATVETSANQIDKPDFEDEDDEEEEEDDEDLEEDESVVAEEPPLPDDIDFEIKVGAGDDAEVDTEEPAVATTRRRSPGETNEDYDASYLGEYDPKLDLSSYKFPSVNLLTKYESSETVVNAEEQKSNKRRIQEVLEQFSIKISSISATVGPTVTLYEIIPEPGVRISRIKSLENDIALSLAALGIRIIAPIPGKGTIGIEVPNREPQVVSMYSVINSKKFQESKYDLPMVLGRTITNDVFMVDLCKMPHVLVAGATGQGKSVGLNAMITSLLYKKHPAELKFVMVDPKMVEFSVYSTIEKHYLAKLPDDGKAIITDSEKVKQTLSSLTREMDDRYNLLMLAGVRNLKEYNVKYIARHLNPEKGHKFLPYIVVIIDEFGDLIMTAGKEIEMPIARIAQKARAVGIHMIIATQRPTTNIITGTIKANFPARIAFRVSSGVDSRTILDSLGANQLIGRGDMLFSQGSDLVRVQCAFVDTPEVVNIAHFIGDQRSYPTAFYLPEPATESSSGMGPTDMEGLDPLFEDAARIIVIHQQGSTSLIQRKFSIGYNRAGRIVDQLEQAGIIGPSEGSKARQVLVNDEFQLDNLLARIK